jgi:hypothetical protein
VCLSACASLQTRAAACSVAARTLLVVTSCCLCVPSCRACGAVAEDVLQQRVGVRPDDSHHHRHYWRCARPCLAAKGSSTLKRFHCVCLHQPLSVHRGCPWSPCSLTRLPEPNRSLCLLPSLTLSLSHILLQGHHHIRGSPASPSHSLTHSYTLLC